MANKIQKFLFNLSTMAPVALILALVYWLEQDVQPLIDIETGRLHLIPQSIFLMIVMFVSIVFSFYSLSFVRKCKRYLEPIPIAIDSISSNDVWIIAVLLSYAMPAASFVFNDGNLYITGAIIAVMLLILAVSNVILPNPLLMLGKYHFYKITNADGGGEICLLSTRSGITNRNFVSEVICAFDYLAIEER